MTEQALQALLDSLSVDEKVGQLCQIDMSSFLADAGSPTGPMAQFNLTREQIVSVGSLICGGEANAADFAKVHETIRKEAPHGIPPLIMSDVIHGMRTIFPIPLALGSTFDETEAETMGRISAKEAAACGIHVTFAPMADVTRDPRWGRSMESVGEAPALCGAMSAAMVRGFHADGLKSADSLATCAKHFVGYGAVEAGRDYAAVDISRTELYNTYLPPFKDALDAGCDMVMPAFTLIDRKPAVANHWLLTKVLRERWGWEGMTISDWGSTGELLNHGMAADLKQASLLAFKAGNDMDMMSYAYITTMKELVTEGRISMEELDRSVMRVLRLKNDLGLFEQPAKHDSYEEQLRVTHQPEHRAAARAAARKSCVLLKNEGALPIKPGMKVALCGAFADEHGLLGGWSANGQTSETPSLRDVLSAEKRVTLTDLADADVILFATGEPQSQTGEATSKAHPFLAPDQLAELDKLAATGKPVVMILFCGRPLMIADVVPKCAAVLNAWFPGSEGAAAIAELLLGDANPSGHLSMTFPRALGQVPIHHDAMPTGRPAPDEGRPFSCHYLDERNSPLYAFGHGLSYTTFAVSDIKASGNVTADAPARITAKVTNTGVMDGDAVLQMYVHMRVSVQDVPLKKLVAWKRVQIKAGESAEVAFDLTWLQLCSYDADGEIVAPEGVCDVLLGQCSDETFNLSVNVQ